MPENELARAQKEEAYKLLLNAAKRFKKAQEGADDGHGDLDGSAKIRLVMYQEEVKILSRNSDLVNKAMEKAREMAKDTHEDTGDVDEKGKNEAKNNLKLLEETFCKQKEQVRSRL